MDPYFDPVAAKPGRFRLATHWAAIFAAALTWPLVFAGGLVTTYRVGMAVPDWPTTFGENMLTYDLWNAAFGVRVEHVHRLFGTAVGLVTIALMVDFLIFDRRKSVKALGVLALLLVIGQGVLGGLRVTRNSTQLAMIHGCTGQAFFAFMVGVATVTARSWFLPRRPVPREGLIKGMALGLLGVTYLQIVLGAWLRHFPSTGALASHAGTVLLVVLMAGATIGVIRKRKADVPGLLGPLRAIEVTLALQLLLGVAAWALLRPFDGVPHPVDTTQALIRTGHQANAALLLAATVVLVVRLYGKAAGVPELQPKFEPVEGTVPRGLGVVAS